MRIGIASHTAIDHIINNAQERVSIGGPTYYAGSMLKRLGIEPVLITRIGYDFPLEMDKYSMIDRRYAVAKPSTRFRLVINGYDRRLFLLARCEDLSSDDITDLDAYIISPIANEISQDMLMHFSRYSNVTFLDPQGFVRRFRNGECYIARTNLKMNVDIIKMDQEEAYALTGLDGLDAMRSLRCKIVISTSKDSTRMLYDDKLYTITFEPIESIDSTGIGDIFAATYLYSYMKDRDPVWSLASAVASSLTSLKRNSFGIEKIPDGKMIEEETESILKMIKVSSI